MSSSPLFCGIEVILLFFSVRDMGGMEADPMQSLWAIWVILLRFSLFLASSLFVLESEGNEKRIVLQETGLQEKEAEEQQLAEQLVVEIQ